jgi:hypothetical protein
MESVVTYVNKAGSVSPWNEGEGQVVHVPVDGCRVCALKSRFDFRLLKKSGITNLGKYAFILQSFLQNG